MIFHENRLLADHCHKISFPIFLKLEKMSQNLLSAAVVIGALRVNIMPNAVLHACFQSKELCLNIMGFYLFF